MAAFVEKQDVRVTRDIAGTGARRGDVGKVVFVQQGRRDIGRSTDLAPTAYQVRFPRGMELWMTEDEIEPVAAAEGAEVKPSRAAAAQPDLLAGS